MGRDERKKLDDVEKGSLRDASLRFRISVA